MALAPWNVPPPTYDAPSYTTSTLTPYLQLPHLLSLTWLAYPIISLAFVAFRLQLSLASSQESIANAKGMLLASCTAAEGAATSAASMPRFMAIASNEQFADAVNGTLNAARAALILALTVMEAVINFIVDLYRSTFLCFLELVVQGGLAILIAAVQELNDAIQSVASGLQTSIQNNISGANSAIQTAIDGINAVNPFSDITAPQISVPNLDALSNVTLPASFEQTLTDLNNTLPTFDDLKQTIESLLDTPFELLKKDINDTFATISFNSSVLPIPQQNTLSFCGELDLSVVDDLGKDLVHIAMIGTLILILLILLLIGLNCLLEWYKWRCLKAHMEYTRQAWVTDPTLQHRKSTPDGPQVTLSDHNMLILSANSTHPIITRMTNNMSQRLHLSPLQHTSLQWFFNYIFHPPAMACLLIGLIGILSIEIQLFAIGSLASKYEARSASTAADFSNTIATSINGSMYNQSATYATQVNGQMDTIQNTLNGGVFGWVNTTTVSLNDTLNEFYTDIQNAVTTVFNNTILDAPAQAFIQCFIGSKVQALEQALTFLHDNIQIEVPRVNDTVLMLSPESVNEVSTPIAAAAVGGGNDSTGLIPQLVESYASSLKKERIMFLVFIALWVFVVLMGLCVIFWHSYGKRWVEKYKRRKFLREQRVGINDLVVPFKDGAPAEKPRSKASEDLPSFTPLPSPKGNPFMIPFSFGRSVSPKTDTTADESRSGSTDSLEPKEKERRGWSFFGAQKPDEKVAKPPKRKPVKLKAIGRKAMGREQLVDDREAMAGREPSLVSDNDDRDENQRSTVWFGRIANILGVKRPDSDAQPSIGFPRDSMQTSNRPDLRVVVDPPTSTKGQLVVHVNNSPRTPGPSSRWSSSPQEQSSAWRNIIQPVKRSPPRPPPISLPMRLKPRHKVISTSEIPLLSPVQPMHFAPPLHHGFNHTQRNTRARQSTLPTPMLSPRHFQPRHERDSLVVPPQSPWTRRRISSMPVPGQFPTSVTPATRLLTTTHARKPSSVGWADVDPFVTPFDDEHRVRIEQPANLARKSIPTNPFSGPGFAM